MKTILIVAPHFLPAFLPSVHRARLLSYHLPEFGWRPVILTTDPRYYECQVSPEMLELLPPHLEVIRTRALPVKPMRLLGDIALRSLYWYDKAITELARRRRIDFLLFTIPASLASLLGPRVHRRFGIPYGIDYIDPWVHETDLKERPLSKAWFASRVSRFCEPIAVRRARLVSGINPAYFESVLRRNPHLRGRVETAGMPYGGSERDFEALDRRPRKPFLFDPADGLLHLVYAGALLPKAFEVLDALLAAVSRLRSTHPALAARLRLHFVGTGMIENDPNRGHVVAPWIGKHGLSDLAQEMPSRIGYLDVLNHLRRSAGILVLGSSEAHYSPSKVYQSVMAQRPVFAVLHAASTAVGVLRSSRAGTVVTFDEAAPDIVPLSAALADFLQRAEAFDPGTVDWAAFRQYSARESARILAGALDRAVGREAGG